MNGEADFKVTLLGTGVPIPSPDRFGPSTLVEAGDQKLQLPGVKRTRCAQPEFFGL
jgi:ribonuclease BN (tRNA processing enzyme)